MYWPKTILVFPFKVIKPKLPQPWSIGYILGHYQSILTRSQLKFSVGRLQQLMADLWQTFYKEPFQNGLPADFVPIWQTFWQH